MFGKTFELIKIIALKLGLGVGGGGGWGCVLSLLRKVVCPTRFVLSQDLTQADGNVCVHFGQRLALGLPVNKTLVLRRLSYGSLWTQLESQNTPARQFFKSVCAEFRLRVSTHCESNGSNDCLYLGVHNIFTASSP